MQTEKCQGVYLPLDAKTKVELQMHKHSACWDSKGSGNRLPDLLLANEKIHSLLAPLLRWVRSSTQELGSVLNVIKASTAVIYGCIMTVNHSPCYKTFLRP